MKTQKLLFFPLMFLLINFCHGQISSGTNINFEELFSKIDANDDGRKKKDDSGPTEGQGGSGGGETKFDISLNWPASGNMLNKNTVLKWSTKAAGPFEIIVKPRISRPSDPGVYRALVNGNQATIPLSELNLKDGKKYAVQVLSTDNETVKSRKAGFVIVSRDDYKKIISHVTADSRFMKESKVNQILMKAFALEKNKLFLDARSLYSTFMDDDKDDALLRNMRDNFFKNAKFDF